MNTLSAATPAEILALLRLPDARLFAQATALREAAFGRRIVLCAIINARSGDCAMDCRFCSQSRHNRTPVDIFPLLPDAVLRERILKLAALPVARIGVVTSGAMLGGDELDRLCGVIAALPGDVRGRVCASLGRLPAESLARLRAAGLTRLHHNLETSRNFYPQICTSQTWDQRRDTALRAVEAGLTVCSGGLFGLGESWEDRVDFAFSLKGMGVRHVPLNFLHPHPETPLAGRPPLDATEALRIIAVFRHILPDATLRVCGGRPLTLGARQREIFAAGANALMTGDYLTTRGQGVAHDLAMIEAQGLEAACDVAC
ncbi:biotin synthase BioB [uncultured Desulfovibrio sp.]|uniref:biotin synthase BioB n=1 Tax=uncultured Desulfovibrio sp. TaxID=167968 RepID=UPI0026120605|nr:biotin synthase BioB [uncultured Desulfovibrio sp.]